MNYLVTLILFPVSLVALVLGRAVTAWQRGWVIGRFGRKRRKVLLP